MLLMTGRMLNDACNISEFIHEAGMLVAALPIRITFQVDRFCQLTVTPDGACAMRAGGAL